MRSKLLVLGILTVGLLLASTADAGHRRHACSGCAGSGYRGSGYSYGYHVGYANYNSAYYAGPTYGTPGYVHTTGYGGYPTSDLYATRAAYGYGYYRPYGTYYGPRHYTYSYGAFQGAYSPGYLPPRYYGGYGYWGGVGSGYYYGAGSRVSVGVGF